MTRSLDLKREKEAYEKYLEEEESRKRHEYLQRRDVRDNVMKEKRAQLEAARETFVQKRIDEEDIKTKDRTLMENLRYELQQDEAKRLSDWRHQKEVQKRIDQKEIMNIAEQEASEYKSSRLQQEALMEEEYRRYIREKQAKDDEAERKFAQQRKYKELQLKKEVIIFVVLIVLTQNSRLINWHLQNIQCGSMKEKRNLWKLRERRRKKEQDSC